MESQPRAGRALLFFGALGVGWAANLASALRVGTFAHDGRLGPAMYALIPLATALTGALVTSLTVRRRIEHTAIAVMLVPFMGLVTGVTVGLIWWPPNGVGTGGHDGILFGLASAAVIVPTSFLFISRARVGALVDRAEGWRAGAVGGALVAASSLLSIRPWGFHPGPSPDGMSITGWLGLAGASVCLCGLVHTRLLVARAVTGRSSATAVDLGLGDRRTEIEVPRADPYRGGAVSAILHGDRSAAEAACSGSVRVGVGAVALSVMAVLLRVMI